jgi:hypothetical protein
MPDIKPFLTLHPQQIREIAASLDIPSELTARQASPEAKAFALQACEEAGVIVPAAGAFTLHEANGAAAKAFDTPEKRIKWKAEISAGGLLLEVDNSTNKLAVVTAGLMMRKAGIPAPPNGKPYSVREFDDLLAATDISISHRLEIKNACFQAGVINNEGTVVSRPAPPPPIAEAKRICERLRLDWPEPGKKLMASRVNDAMDTYGWPKYEGRPDGQDFAQRVHAKNVFAAAGAL